MARPSFHPRCSEKEIRKFCKGFKGWDLAKVWLVIHEMVFGENPQKVSRELAEFDRANPDENLRLKV